MTLERSFDAATDFDAALDTLARRVTTLGFDAVDYGYMPQVRTADGGWCAPDIAARNIPARWERGWARFSRDDPFLWCSYDRNLPLDWQEVRGARWLSDMQTRAIAYLDQLGFPDGLTVPIHLARGRFAFVSALSSSASGAWRDRPVSAAEDVFVLAHAFHAAVAEFTAPESAGGAPALSPREREALHHAACGLSAPTHAQRSGRSPETVRRQRKSAMAKLGARTIAEAVSKAIARGLVEAP